MKTNQKTSLGLCVGFTAAFLLWTILIQRIDVRPLGVNQTPIGFATLNLWFHKAVGVHLSLYTLTDWLSLIPIGVSLAFGGMGVIQLIKRKGLLQVDFDILLLGVYYGIVIGCYLLFEQIPINYRPVLFGGVAEVSYPSSTTLLVLSVMASTMLQVNKRINNSAIQKLLRVPIGAFCLFMVVGRVLAGVHWLTDIIGAVLLSFGLFYGYKTAVLCCPRK